MPLKITNELIAFGSRVDHLDVDSPLDPMPGAVVLDWNC